MEAFAARHEIDLDASYAYSDSLSDLPMLRAVGNPVAVNPDPPLAEIAKQEGWQTMRFERLGRRLVAVAVTLLATRRRLRRLPRRRPPQAAAPALRRRDERPGRLDCRMAAEPGSKPEFKQRDAEFTTISGQAIEPLYAEDDLDPDLEERVGEPGEYPFTRGPYPSMYRGRLWTMRQFAGFGTVEETNERFHYLLDHGQTGLSTAFDMPTLMGYDSDHERSLGEVGREGVAVDSLDDMEQLFAGIPLGGVTTSMTINAPAAILLAFYVLVGESRACRRRSSGARSRPTSSRSTSPRRSGASRSSRRCGWSPT